MKTYEKKELRELFDGNLAIRETARNWMRESDGDFVYEQMEELRDVMRFEVDAWDNVYAWPRQDANHCGELAATIRNSMYGYPSTIEDALAKLERYAEGVDRLGGYIYYLPEHFETAIEEVEKEICSVYAKQFKSEYEWWMDADDDYVFEQFECYFECNPQWWIGKFVEVFCPEIFEEEDEEDPSELGKCPECGDVHSVDCQHETVNGNEVSLWCVCGNCGNHFIEVLRLARVEKWSDRR